MVSGSTFDLQQPNQQAFRASIFWRPQLHRGSASATLTPSQASSLLRHLESALRSDHDTIVTFCRSEPHWQPFQYVPCKSVLREVMVFGLQSTGKRQALANLAEQRRAPSAGTVNNGYSRNYKRIEQFHNGYYDVSDWPSPWTASSSNVDSDLMIVGQDWASEEFLSGPPCPHQRELGEDRELPTNKNLARLLRETFGRELRDVYRTNAFVFVKPGGMSGSLPSWDVQLSALTYTLREIEIVRPNMVVCLGSTTLNAIRRAIKLPFKSLREQTYSETDAVAYGAEVFGVPHVGARGLAATGGMSRSMKIWQELAQRSRRAGTF